LVRISLKFKMTAVVSLLVAVVVPGMAFLGLDFFEENYKKTLGVDQFAMVAALAEEIDGKFQSARNQLTAVAGIVPPEILDRPKEVQLFLDHHPELLNVFDNGILFLSATGKPAAVYPLQADILGMDFSDRAYFRETRSTGRPFISQPFISRQKRGHPILMFTAPIFDPQGKVAAVLGGSLDLLGENFLARMINLKMGRTDTFFLFNTEGTILLHADTERIFQQQAQAGSKNPLEAALHGFEGYRESIDLRGLPALTAFKRLSAVDWILGANYPLAEAYAPIRQARQYFLAWLVAVLLLAVVTAWLFMRHLTAPLVRISRHVGTLAAGKKDLAPLPIETRDEIGTLALAFNQLTAQISQDQRTIQNEKEFAENLLEHAAAPIFVIDANHRVLFWNRACEELTGLKTTEVKGTDEHWRAFYDHRRPCLADFIIHGNLDRIPEFYGPSEPAELIDEGVQVEGWRTTLSGAHRYIIFRAAPLRNKKGDIIAATETLEDITERKKVERRMEFMAHFDPLTGLPNRTLFFDRLTHGLTSAERYREKLGLLYIDLDGFKEINDRGGHDQGDRVLSEVAQSLKKCVRTCDTAARIGGDEFALILARVDGCQGVKKVAARVLDCLAGATLPIETSQTLGASIGISIFPDHGTTADDLLKKADSAMYLAKAAGKNQYRISPEEDNFSGDARAARQATD